MTAPPKRRVLMTTDAVGGVWVYATELARALCRSGSRVTLAVMGPPPRPDQLAALQGIRGLKVEVTDLALEWMEPEGADVPRARAALSRIADRVRPDVIHLNGYREACFDWPAPVLAVAHSCVWSWWDACRGGMPDEPRWRNYFEAVARGLGAADAWVAPSRAFCDSVEAIYRPGTRGRVIRNGIDLHPAAAAKQPFILAAGRLWDEAKNLARLAALAPALDWPVRVAGPTQGPGTTAGADFANVAWVGILPRPALTAEMQRAAIFVSPALYEPFGLTVLEAAASGCALVLADIASFRELWDGAALFVDPRDEHAIRDGVQAVCRHDRLRGDLQRAARARARRYSLASMALAYGELYGTLAASGATSRSTAPMELRA